GRKRGLPAWVGTARRSISVVGRFTPTHRLPSRLPTISVARLPPGKPRSHGRRGRMAALCTRDGRATARRWMCHFTRGLSVGIESTGERVERLQTHTYLRYSGVILASRMTRP